MEHGPVMLTPAPFTDPERTSGGDLRASVPFVRLSTLWFNTGTLCNITCQGCYIESSPRNDRLVYLTPQDVIPHLDEIAALGQETAEIGFTGGEPFMNRDILALLELALERGFRVLVLTNAMKPLANRRAGLLALHQRFGDRLTLRVSLDHHTAARHEELRGAGSWAVVMKGLAWLRDHGFSLAIAVRTRWGEPPEEERAGYARLFADLGLSLDPGNPADLVLFPEMDEAAAVPEISTACWGLLGKTPDQVMCATSRMVIRRKGAERATVVACTLLPYDPRFELGPTLAGSFAPIPLLHRHCARFCVLGGGACSAA